MRFFLIAAFMTAVLSAGSGCEKKQADANPFFTVWDTPFGVPPFDKIKNGHYKPAIEKGIADHAAEIDSIVANPDAPSFENVIAALDHSGELLKKAYAAFAQVKAADSNDELQEADLAIAPAVSAHYDDIYLNDRLFEKISAVHEQIGGMALSAEQIRLTEQTYKQFVRAGAQLNARQKERLRDINRELSLLSVRFGNNLLAETRDFTLVVESSKDISGVPQTVTDAAADKAKEMEMTDKWVFTLSPPSMIPFLTYAENRGLREKLYTGYVKRGSNGNQFDNRQIVNDIIRLRTEKARLMDYPSYAAFVLDDRMAKTPERVYDLLDKLWKPALDTAKRELETLRAIKAKETQDSAFAAWDWRYYAEKVRKSQYNLDQTSLNLYFSLDNVRSGVFQLSNRLWGLTFRPVSVPVYNKECSAYEVLDKDNTHLGVLYFDLYPRDGKRGGRLVRHVSRSILRYGRQAHRPDRHDRLQLHPSERKRSGPTDARRNRNAVSRVRTRLAQTIFAGTLRRTEPGRARLRGTALADHGKLGDRTRNVAALRQAPRVRGADARKPDPENPQKQAVQPGIRHHGTGSRGAVRHRHPYDRRLQTVRSGSF